MRASSLRPFLFTIALSLGASAQAADDGADLFEKRVRPALARNCFACHSASGGVAMGELQLDSAEAMAKGGKRGPAVVPGKPAESLLLRAVLHSDPALAMPPSGKLADADIAALTEWVAAGAVWPAEKAAGGESKTFWAFVPPVEPKLPQVQDKEWAQSPIDHFVLSALEAKGLHPAAPADKRTLIRRATFDLTGLPPTPEEIYAFLSDDSPEAFAKVVDRLLASPRYGERWGRHWLDVARYADSNGLDENLVYKNAFRYRDYVIAAFNKDKPYDLFVQEQLAGDLLPKAEDIETTFERWTATGFLSLGAKMLAEDDPVKMQMDIVDEQLDTTARTFMGLTMGCARCHDHKFDPIPQADYYAMAGIFKSSKTMENFNVVARWHEYVLAPKEDRDRLAEHEAKIEAKSKEISAVSNAENRRLVVAAWERTGDYLLAADDALRYRAIELKPKMGDGIVRDAVTFDRGNVEAVIEKGKTNVPKDAKGPFFAEYDVTVDAAGEYQLDFLDLEMGGGTADISVNGVLESYGEPPVTNRAASPDAGGWTVAGVYPLVAGRNTIRLEHKSRYPYFEALAVAKSELSENPKSVAQIARQYDVIPGFLEQWVERLERSQGAPASVLFAWHAFHDGQPLDGWSSPAAKAFGEQAADRPALAQRYQALFSEAARQW
ncbi:MAG: DUF1549 domain-containing protein, partial [Acidobacteria bacterium]|nr:DUF1549 domain-containing protein [Acidobacteriota bacterium]